MSPDVPSNGIRPHEIGARDTLAHLRRALEVADEAGLPLEIPARIQEVIDACEKLSSSDEPPRRPAD